MTYIVSSGALNSTPTNQSLVRQRWYNTIHYDTIRDTIFIFNVRSKADINHLSLPYRVEPTTKSGENKKLQSKKKTNMLRRVRKTVRGIRGVRPEEEKAGCGGENKIAY